MASLQGCTNSGSQVAVAIGVLTVALMFVSPQRGTCSMQHFWHMEFWHDSHTFWKICAPLLWFIWFVYLTTSSVFQTAQNTKREQLINKVFERLRKEEVFATLRYYPSIYWSDLEELRGKAIKAARILAGTWTQSTHIRNRGGNNPTPYVSTHRTSEQFYAS